MERFEQILRFWFGGPDDDPLSNFSWWFSKNDATDKRIHDLFEKDLNLAIQGKLDQWKDNPRGCLAFIILTDQFPRNMYRGLPGAFANDGLALLASLEGQKRGFDISLTYVERWFFYMPIMHSEDIEIQKRSVELFYTLAKQAPQELREILDGTYKYALRHFKIIERFGRFPHRNKILGRESTEKEIEFLKGPDSSF